MSKISYANVVGSLMYVMQAIKWILRYIHNTMDIGLIFEQEDNQCVTNDNQLLVMRLLLQRRQLVGSLLHSQQLPYLLQKQSIWQSLRL
ncbi:potassium channel SKOR-like [Gossypium australe]|uniref:Potassium channel SKOR-like n=1 Tax=Gossypium australe TaxID=47621 RepID=A0A5B6VJS7_9ROSI|nr:potassium channel SKOR-like [Gossypium australe]